MRVTATDFLRATKEENTRFVDRCIALGYCTRPRRREDWNPYPDDEPPRHVHYWDKDGHCLTPGCETSRAMMYQQPEMEPIHEESDSKIIQLP